MTDPKTRAEVLRLEALATKGPWEWHGDSCLSGPGGCDDVLDAADDGRPYGMHHALIEHHYNPETAEANKGLIVASRNIIKQLIEDLHEAQAKIAGIHQRHLPCACKTCVQHTENVRLAKVVKSR